MVVVAMAVTVFVRKQRAVGLNIIYIRVLGILGNNVPCMDKSRQEAQNT